MNKKGFGKSVFLPSGEMPPLLLLLQSVAEGDIKNIRTKDECFSHTLSLGDGQGEGDTLACRQRVGMVP